MATDHTPSTVYLVEDHTAADGRLRYWAHVYLSVDRAKRGVGDYAQRNGYAGVRWVEHAPVWDALPPGEADETARELYSVVPLTVRGDDEPDP